MAGTSRCAAQYALASPECGALVTAPLGTRVSFEKANASESSTPQTAHTVAALAVLNQLAAANALS